ncbi:MAG: hypothetical protein ACRD2W_22855 [Acidimicrobiales bacterium]
MEDLPDDARALRGLVERAEENADGQRRWFSQGVSDGMTWARGASYVELKSVAEGPELTPSAAEAIERGKVAHSDVVGYDQDSYVAGWRFADAEEWRRVETKI